jgi:cytochrome P450
MAFFRALNTNPITAWSRQAYQQPFLHLKGGVLRPDMIMVTDPAMVRRIFVEEPGLYDKGDVVRRRLRPALGDSMLIAGETTWRPQRRIAAPLFSARRVESFLQDMVRTAEEVSSRLADEPDGSVVDVSRLMLRLTYEVISRTAFSAEGVSDPDAFSQAIADYFDTLGRVDLASYMRLPEWIPTLGRIRARPSLALFRREIGGVIERRRKRMAELGPESVPDDLLTRMLTTPDPQTGRLLSPELVYDNTVTFLAAGHETTANLLSWTLFLLGENPDWEERVVDEIERVVAGATPTTERLAALTDTRMVLDEVLRLYPPAPVIPRVAERADQLGPIAVRKGAIVFTSPYIAQRHEAWWSEPRAFRPERFAAGKREAIDRYIYFPFGLGPRICIGASFALQEALTVLALLLPRFRFRAERPEAVFPQSTITLKPGDSLPMRVTRR